MRGERGYSRSNKWILKKSTSGFGVQQVGNVMQQVEKGNATGGNWKMQQVEKVI